MQMCVSRLVMPAVEIKTAVLGYTAHSLYSQLPLGLNLLVDNIAPLNLVSQALQAVCKV